MHIKREIVTVHTVMFFVALLIVYLSKDVGIFWDNVVFGSRMAKHLYENGLLSWRFPVEIDPGHPPLFPFYLALGWTLFGKSLWVSHLLMAPFIYGILIQLHKLNKHFFKQPLYIYSAVVFLFLDPTFLAQMLLVSVELLILFFFLLTLNAMLKGNKVLWVVGLLFLGLCSFRGMMLCAGLFLIDVSLNCKLNFNSFKNYIKSKRWAYFMLGSISSLTYIVAKKINSGYIQFNEKSPYATMWTFVDTHGFVRNVLDLGFKYLDYGRGVYILFVVFMVITTFKKMDQKAVQLLKISMLSCLLIGGYGLFLNNTMGERYYWPSFVLFGVLAMYFLVRLKYWKIYYTLMIVCMLACSLVVLPDHIAKSWDATPNHFSYWNLRKEGLAYLKKEKISIDETGTFFPNYTSLDNIDLNNDHRAFQTFDGKQKYIFYSNVYNVSDEDLTLIAENYTILKRFCKLNVRVEILKRKL